MDSVKNEIGEEGFSTSLAANSGLPTDRWPATQEEAALVEQTLEDAFQEKLSLDDRESIILETLGTTTTFESKKEQILLVAAVDQEIMETVPEQDRLHYQRAKQVNSEYVTKWVHRILQLHSDNKAAALKTAYHFRIKAALFPHHPQILARNVLFSDLTMREKDRLRKGLLQKGYHADLAGRTLVYLNPALQHGLSSLEASRIWWYFLQAIVDDLENNSQVVVVAVNLSGFMGAFHFVRQIRKPHIAMPLHVVAIHYAYTSLSLRPFVAGLRLFLFHSHKERLRLVPHYEPSGVVELAQSLYAKYGIPLLARDHTEGMRLLPLQSMATTVPGEFYEWSTEWHEQWLVKIVEREEQLQTRRKESVEPGKFDVLFGKDKRALNHSGNRRCQVLINYLRPRYERSNRRQKTAVADEVLQSIKLSGGRFLRWEKHSIGNNHTKGAWVEVKTSVAREKVSHWFRRLREKDIPESNSAVREDLGHDVSHSTIVDI